jgi:hypothetical protein
MAKPVDPRTEWMPKGLAKPAHRALLNAGVGSREQLAAFPEARIAALHGMGPNGVHVLREALAAKGLTFFG